MWEPIYYAVTGIILLWSLFTPSGRNAWSWFFNNFITAAIGQAKPLLATLTPELASIIKAFSDAMTTAGPSLAKTVAAPIGNFAASNFTSTIDSLSGAPESTAENAVELAALAIADAFGKGLSSAAVTAAFESMFPERLNTLNGIGPMLAQMAGFGNVSDAIREPLYRAAFGKSAEYRFNAQFSPNLPDAHTAAQWLARGIIGDVEFNILYVASGLKGVYSPPVTEAAYRPLQPRMFATLIGDSTFPEAPVRDAMRFAGIRQTDIDFLVPLLEYNATKTIRQGYLTALERSVELGTDTPQALTQAMDSMGYSTDAQTWVQLTVAERKLEQLAELYRKSISEGYKTGQITDAQYVPALEAVGIGSADAQAHYAVDSIARTGKIMMATAKAEAMLARQRTSAAVKAAIETFQNGGFGVVSQSTPASQHTFGAADSGAGAIAALEAALLAAGMDPAVAGFAVEYQVARLAGRMVYIYGLTLTRDDALLLKERVAALSDQYKKQLIDDVNAAASIADYGIPEANARALLAGWAALKVAPTHQGVLLPR